METTDAASDCEIVTVRIFKASRQLVYRAWTDPGHLANWWGPAGFTNTFTTFDLRKGGKWHFVMHVPDKGNYVNECTFTEIRAPEFLAWDRQSKPLFRVTVAFEALTETETRVTFKQIFETAAACNKIKAVTAGKNDENMDRLEQELQRIK